MLSYVQNVIAEEDGFQESALLADCLQSDRFGVRVVPDQLPRMLSWVGHFVLV